MINYEESFVGREGGERDDADIVREMNSRPYTKGERERERATIFVASLAVKGGMK